MTANAPLENVRRMGSYKWAVVGMLWFICFFNYADRVAISSVFPILREKFHFTNEQLGIIGSAFSWVYAGTAPFAGRIGDRVSRKGLIIGGLYVWSLVTGFTGLCGKFWQFVAVRATEGLGETFYIPSSVALIGDYHGPATRSRALGLHQTSLYAGTVFGGFFAGWMAVRYGWQSPFLILGGAGILLGLVLALFIREPQRGAAEVPVVDDEFDETGEPSEPDWTPIPQRSVVPPVVFGAVFGLVFGLLAGFVVRAVSSGASYGLVFEGGLAGAIAGAALNRPLWRMFGATCSTPSSLLLLLGFVGTNSVALVFLNWTTTYLHDVYGLKVDRAALYGALAIQVGSMAGAVVGGMMADRFRRTRAGGRVLVQAIGTLLGIPFLTAIGFSPPLAVALVALAGFGIAKGIHDSNISAGFFDVVPIHSRAAAVGMLNFVGWGAGAMWTVGFGKLSDMHVPMGTLIASNAGIYVVACCVFFYTALVRAPKDIHASATN